jgi:hypothetical protein
VNRSSDDGLWCSYDSAAGAVQDSAREEGADADAYAGRVEAARLLGARGGAASAASLTPEQRKDRASAAGRASASSLTPEERSQRARKAVQARWARRTKDAQ